MNDFKGLSTDTSTVKTPEQMWQYARNILLSKKYLSIVNEKGNEYGYEVPGCIVGFEVTNEIIVYFSISNGYSCIGYVNNNEYIYKPVIRTNNPNFKFNINSPIECVSVYNYKKELIVIFSDGVNPNSGTVKLVNITNLQKPVDAYGEFINVDDYLIYELFTPNKLPYLKTTYSKGSLDAEVVHIAMAYVYDDFSEGLPTPILKTVYPNFKNKNKIKRNVKIDIESLSSNFNKAKLLFIIEEEGATFAYETPILNIVNNKLSYNLSSVVNLNTSDTGKILLAYERFTKVKTLTKTANQLLIGWTEINDNVNLQQYVNKLELGFEFIVDEVEKEKYKSHPTFLPDEVYSFKFVPLFTNGSRGNAFHLPGRSAAPFEYAIADDTLINSFGLNFPEYKGKGYRRFHFINNGIALDNHCQWGYWQNEELYPNHIDYNSSFIGGEDLRNTPIRYHRFPSPDNITLAGKSPIPVVSDNIDSSIDTLPKFNIYVKNLHIVFPADIIAKLQGYEIVFEKRSKGGSYVEFSGILYKQYLADGMTSEYDEDITITTQNAKPADFSTFNFLSVETSSEQVEITADIVKLYKAVTPGSTLTTGDKIASIIDTEYKLANNIASNNRFSEERLNIKVKHLTAGDTEEAFIPLSTVAPIINIIYGSLITLNKNLYNLENSKDFISIGKIIFDNTNTKNEKLVNGDVFVNNIINKSFSSILSDYLPSRNVTFSIHSYLRRYVYNLYSPLSNHYIVNGSIEGYAIRVSWSTEDINFLNSVNYTTVVKNSNNKYFNDLEGTLSYGLTLNYINKFPYRVYKGLNVPNESLSTTNLRTFLTNQYYDMPNDRGEIIALRGFNNGLFIQQRYSLYRTSISDKLNSDLSQVYLGNTELFDRLPEELVNNKNIGYIGSNNQFACTVFRDGYVTIDEVQGKIFIVGNDVNEISQHNTKNFFRENLPLKNNYKKVDLFGKDTVVDNPYNSIGYIIGFDEEFNRLLVTKKYYTPKDTLNGLTFDGEFYYKVDNSIVDFRDTGYFTDESFTYSYALDSKTWICPHDYTPNIYYYTNKGLFSIINKQGSSAKQYKHNSNNVNPGNFYGKQYESYVDLIFNTRLDINKNYQALYWVSESVNIKDEKIINQFDTIDKVMLYNNHQCSGFINVSKTDLGVSRNTEGIWQLNEFRDMLKQPSNKIIDKDGNLIESNISTVKQWYNKNMFIGNFIVARLVWENKEPNLKYIHNVNVKSVTSKR